MQIDRRGLLASLLALCAQPIASRPALANADLWAAFSKGQAFILLRHALAPGTGDPPGFQLGDCSTQRNLSEAGRQQARRIGDLIRQNGRQNGVEEAAVHSSQWCRCLDTATALRLGKVESQPLLNSFFGTPADGKRQTENLRAWLVDGAARKAQPAFILVTHQVNITALTGIVPLSGEIVFAAVSGDGTVSVLGRQAGPG
ncbi:histidine phosphatase family protein [Peteryoungia ipomoeae]|uniref:Histidine phosphatase family protein n=1 Tax=Peteryoungia ipomoeae TaxID=1210932 RepID=A0A4V4HMP4_9HYPH|nr:histidine phosphatase family protein [Peteryoungia ipomoeae]THV22996.1 histidine phosphatase family protein [Peteryoungia ipomoeae]